MNSGMNTAMDNILVRMNQPRRNISVPQHGKQILFELESVTGIERLGSFYLRFSEDIFINKSLPQLPLEYKL